MKRKLFEYWDDLEVKFRFQLLTLQWIVAYKPFVSSANCKWITHWHKKKSIWSVFLEKIVWLPEHNGCKKDCVARTYEAYLHPLSFREHSEWNGEIFLQTSSYMSCIQHYKNGFLIKFHYIFFLRVAWWLWDWSQQQTKINEYLSYDFFLVFFFHIIFFCPVLFGFNTNILYLLSEKIASFFSN